MIYEAYRHPRLASADSQTLSRPRIPTDRTAVRVRVHSLPDVVQTTAQAPDRDDPARGAARRLSAAPPGHRQRASTHRAGRRPGADRARSPRLATDWLRPADDPPREHVRLGLARARARPPRLSVRGEHGRPEGRSPGSRDHEAGSLAHLRTGRPGEYRDGDRARPRG